MTFPHTALALIYAQGTVAAGVTAQTINPPGANEFVDYGLTAMIATSFFYLVYAMATRKLVAHDTEQYEQATARREEALAALIIRVVSLEEASARREDRLLTYLEARRVDRMANEGTNHGTADKN